MEKSTTLKNFEYIKEHEERLKKLNTLKKNIEKIDEITTKMSGSMDEELLKTINELAQKKLNLQKEIEELKKELGLENISDVDNEINKCEKEIKTFKLSMKSVESEIEEHISKLEEIKESLMPYIKNVGLFADGFEKLNQLDEQLIEFARENLTIEQQQKIIDNCQNAIKKQEQKIKEINSFVEEDATKEIDDAINGYKEILDFIRKKEQPTPKKVVINAKSKKLQERLKNSKVIIKKTQRTDNIVLPTLKNENNETIAIPVPQVKQNDSIDQVKPLRITYQNENMNQPISDQLVNFATNTSPLHENNFNSLIDSLKMENETSEKIQPPKLSEVKITQNIPEQKKSEAENVRNIPPLKRIKQIEQEVEETDKKQSDKDFAEKIVERLMNEDYEETRKSSSNIFKKLKRKVTPQQHYETLKETVSNVEQIKSKTKQKTKEL